MSFGLRSKRRVEDALKRTVRRQLRRPVRALASEDLVLDSAIHQSRKTVKKVRAFAALLREAGARIPRKDRRRLKSAGRALSHLRDGAVVIESLDRVRRRYPKQVPEHTYAILRRHLVAALNEEEVRAKRDGVLATVAARLGKTRHAAKAWKSPSLDAADLAPVIAASYRRSRKAMKHARQTGLSASFHNWRKELKRLWYQLRLVKAVAPGLATLLANLKRLETDLGDDHNLVVLAATLRGCRDLRPMSDQLRQIASLAFRMRQPLRQRALAVGQRAHAQTPKAFRKSMRASMKRGTRHVGAA